MTQNYPAFPFRLHTAPFAEGLTVAHFRGREALSRPYAFDLLTLTPAPMALSDLPAVGQPATFLIGRAEEDEEENPRRVHGVLSRVRLEGIARDREGSWMRIRLVPRLWGLKRRRTRRIFQDQSVTDIVSAILRDWQIPHRWQLDTPLVPVGYCVQYDETDFEFVSRLLAAHGVFYFFEQAAADPGTEEAVETVVFCDAARNYPALQFTGSSKTRVLKLCERDGTYRPTSAVMAFTYEKRVRPTASRLRDYDFRMPQALGEFAQNSSDDPALGSDWLLSDEFHTFSGNDAVRVSRRDARVALEQHRAEATRANGTSDCRDLGAGHKFALNNHDVAHLNAEWVVTEISHEGRVAELLRTVQPGGTSLVYLNTFQCAPAAVPVRPPRHRRPHRQAMETAVVVGPASEEIHTDEFGRIKVQFHWDRDGNYDERSSCWVRVSQGWAGAGWGFQFIPRIGMEVLVSFVGGDTDHPVVVGCLYNGARPPSHALPSQKTRSGIRTLSSPGGSGYNELSFEDASGQELVYLRAEKDLREQVGHDHERTVRNDQTISIGGQRIDSVARDETRIVHGSRVVQVGVDDNETVGGDRVETVRGHQTLNVLHDRTLRVDGSRLEVVGKDEEQRVAGHAQREAGRETHTVHGERVERVEGSHVTVVGTHDAPASFVLHVEGHTAITGSAATEIRSDKAIVLRVGDSSIRITSEKIEISAGAVVLAGKEASISLAEKKVKVKASEDILAKGDKVKLKSSGAGVGLDSDAKIDGGSVKLKSSVDVDIDDPETGEVTTIELVDKDGNPLANQRYVVVLSDGTEMAGVLDKDGKAKLVLDDSAKVYFPDVEEAEAQ